MTEGEKRGGDELWASKFWGDGAGDSWTLRLGSRKEFPPCRQDGGNREKGDSFRHDFYFFDGSGIFQSGELRKYGIEPPIFKGLYKGRG